MFLCHHRPTLSFPLPESRATCAADCATIGTAQAAHWHSTTKQQQHSSPPASYIKQQPSSTAAQQHSSTAAAIKSHALCAAEYARHQWGRINTTAKAFRLLSPALTTHERVGCVLRNVNSRAHARAVGTNRRIDDAAPERRSCGRCRSCLRRDGRGKSHSRSASGPNRRGSGKCVLRSMPMGRSPIWKKQHDAIPAQPYTATPKPFQGRRAKKRIATEALVTPFATR